MSALLLCLKPGDEVIVPAFTFVSTASAFMLYGAKPVFVDVRQDTLNIDLDQAEAAITPRTRAICVVHYGGVACEMDRLTKLAKDHNLILIEDNAHGLFAKYRGKYLGTFGALATQSFHETKNITCGEGGALVINDASLAERAEILRRHRRAVAPAAIKQQAFKVRGDLNVHRRRNRRRDPARRVIA